jgi:hypothetical protein
MANNPPMEFIVEDARLLFRNFAGTEGPMNAAGDRNFCVVLDESVVEPMLADGWNIKRLRPLETEGDDEEVQVGTPYIKVKVGYKLRPPHIVLRTSRARTPLTQDTIEMLDWADIETVDLIAQSSHWSSPTGEGITAYVKSMYVTIREDYLQRKYAELDAVDGELS